ncbi:MAG TPA: POTRA domain-containing protein [Pyrinomonadaceae bacterium]|nr:POTRA domain-containing protein [Pyrinomonadaceae bacterium]
MKENSSHPFSSRAWSKRAALPGILTTFLILLSSPCLAQKPPTLRRIEFVGLRKMTALQAIEASGLKVGDPFTPEIVDAAADKLMQSGLFKKLGYRVRTADNDATVIFEVEEASRNLPVVFENFVWFSEDEIARAIRQDVPFFDGTAPEGGTTTDKIAAALQRLLGQKQIAGKVEHMPYTNLATGRQEILFTVEGVKIPVCSLHFPGANVISEADLIKASQALLKADYSRKDAGGFAEHTLFPLYRHLGYLRAQFKQPTAAIEESPSRCEGGVALTIPVDEGVVYAWEAADWTGNQALTKEDLTTALGMKTGELADGLKIDKGLKEVRKAFGRRGYVGASFKESIEFDDATRRVSYRFAVSEGQRYFMGNLIVNGLPEAEVERLKAKWTLGANAVFDESYFDEFRQTGLREFMTGLMQRTGTRARFDVEMKPNAAKQTVDVIFTFK